ncbi:response regulator transcription factor [Pelagibacterium sp. 26DY04]|uniref:response regulator transcription factor n=1 Tax=Pelagibacterium sp. 26DY04 TaxID=2967130 RepID=UPI0028166B86|nr:response regulator transcription factor [Pelagibacterium sp. 26DY04]WMT87160.1 response regulator transcription factor [Pelagibacterium sp. 26DY04]
MTGSAGKVLVIDDEPPIRKLLRVGLGAEGYSVIEAPNGRDGMEKLASEAPDIVILDLGLPDISGLDLLARWRAASITQPILILSSRTDEGGIVEALDLGADDYVTKPFGIKELVARMRVALRHKLQQQGEHPIYKAGDLTIDLVKRLVRMGEEDVRLSPKEYDILRILVQHAGKVITHRHLLNEIWDGTTDVQYLRVYVRQLRQKLEPSPDAPQYITTEPGVGYRMREPD